MKKILLLFLLCACQLTYGQTFKAYVAAGINASQIEGDGSVGYKRIGLQSGLGIAVNLSERWMLGTEFNFSQRGSQNLLFPKENQIKSYVALNYIELPLLLKLQDKFRADEDFHRLYIEGGISAGRLISANMVTNQQEIIEKFRSTDLSFIVGGGFYLNKRIFFNIRYSRSILPIYTDENASKVGQVRYLIPYFITLRSGYSF